MTTYNELIAYFETMPVLVPGVKGVTVGNDEAIMSLENSQINYPHLWVETPGIRFTGTDENPGIRFSFGLVIIDQENQKTPAEGNNKLSSMLSLLTQVYNQLLADSDADLFDLILSDNEGDPIRQWSGDNAYGWRLDVQIEIQRVECGPPIGEWIPDPITGSTHTFTLQAGKLLLAIYIKSDTDQNPQVGTTPGGDEIGAAGYTVPAGEYTLFSGLNLYAENDTDIHLSGLSGTNTLKVWTINDPA